MYQVLRSLAPKLSGHTVKWFSDNQNGTHIVHTRSRKPHLQDGVHVSILPILPNHIQLIVFARNSWGVLCMRMALDESIMHGDITMGVHKTP